MVSHVPNFPGKDTVTSQIPKAKESTLDRIKGVLHKAKDRSKQGTGGASEVGSPSKAGADTFAGGSAAQGAGGGAITGIVAGGAATEYSGRGNTHDDFGTSGGGPGCPSASPTVTQGSEASHPSTGIALSGNGAKYQSSEAASGYRDAGSTDSGATQGPGAGYSTETRSGGTSNPGKGTSTDTSAAGEYPRGVAGATGAGAGRYDDTYARNTGAGKYDGSYGTAGGATGTGASRYDESYGEGAGSSGLDTPKYDETYSAGTAKRPTGTSGADWRTGPGGGVASSYDLVEGDKLESGGPGQGGGFAAGGLATGAGAGTTEHGSESGNAQTSGPVNAPTTAGPLPDYNPSIRPLPACS